MSCGMVTFLVLFFIQVGTLFFTRILPSKECVPFVVVPFRVNNSRTMLRQWAPLFPQAAVARSAFRSAVVPMGASKGSTVLLAADFNASFYRVAHPEVRTMNDAAARSHYERIGRLLGLDASGVHLANAFVEPLQSLNRVLELWPSCPPAITGVRVKYADSTLIIAKGTKKCPKVDFVLPNDNIEAVTEVFDALYSANGVVKQLDFVGHLIAAEQLLFPGGRYFLVLPDRRYGRVAASRTTIADVLDSFHVPQSYHSLKTLIEVRAMETHMSPAELWAGDGSSLQDARNIYEAPFRLEKVRRAIQEWSTAGGRIVNIQKWYFSPDSFAEIMRYLYDLRLTNFTVERLYHTIRNETDFRVILKLVPP